jgi:predicted AAA+ superfamily ATPase
MEKNERSDFSFVNFEDFRLLGFAPLNFADIIDAHYELYGKKPKFLFFDEIQNVNEYRKALRTLKDQGFKIVIS